MIERCRSAAGDMGGCRDLRHFDLDHEGDRVGGLQDGHLAHEDALGGCLGEDNEMFHARSRQSPNWRDGKYQKMVPRAHGNDVTFMVGVLINS